MKVELVIEKVVPQGIGMGRVNGKVLFVEDVIPGERVIVKVISNKKDYMVGSLLEIKEASKGRVTPLCKYAGECGGCQWQFISYEMQKKLKEEMIKEAFFSVSGIKELPLVGIYGMKDPWKYRSRVYLPVRRSEGKVGIGYYKKRSHDLVDIDSCVVALPQLSGLIPKLKKFITEEHLSVYDELSFSGRLRHLILMGSYTERETLVGFITRKLYLSKNQAKKIKELDPLIVGVVENENRTKGNRIFGDRFRLLTGREFYYHIVNGIKMTVSFGTFFQVNHMALKLMLHIIEEFLVGKEFTKSLDLYGGSGVFSTSLVKYSQEVIIVENNLRATVDARRWIREYHLEDRVKVVAEDVENVIDTITGYQLILVDPPRKGLSYKVLNSILTQKPHYVIYVSCNPSTLARDTRILIEGGYEFLELRLVDMFPHTYHVESIAFFKHSSIIN